MKILYVSPQPVDPSLSQAANTASGWMVLTSATRLDDAAHWIFSNLDVAALILDSDFGLPHCASFLRNLRSRGLSAPLILIAAEEASWREGLGLSDDDRVLQKDVFCNDFDGAVMSVISHASRTELQKHLTRSEAALRQIGMRQAEATENAAQREARLRAELANITTLKDALIRQIAEHHAARKSLEQQIESKNGMLQEILGRLDHDFDDYPLPLCRASRAGVITNANRAFGALLGCPAADAKRRLSLASELLESSDEFAWLMERSTSSQDVSSIECTRRKVDGSRLMLRLRAMPGSETTHILIEDLTPTWMLQERLHRAQQMEAVGRMAAEVALTSATFLRDATKHGCRLVAMLEDGSEARRSGEQLIGEVDRVALSLRQLAAYADDEAMSVDPVDLHQVLHDLEPILQELAGDDVQVVLPERPPREVPPFNVDVTTQRVERLLVNLARFSRERITSGGRLVFDVASGSVDGQFLSKHPNVRPGPHVLLTVTQAGGGDGNGAAPTVGASGVQLSALHGLVRHCGGHLWMDTAPAGEIIKIRLPLRAA